MHPRTLALALLLAPAFPATGQDGAHSPSGADAAPFAASVEEARTWVLARSSEEVRVAHQWPEGGPFGTADFTLAVPPVGDLTASVVAVRLTAREASPGEEREVRVLGGDGPLPPGAQGGQLVTVREAGWIRHSRLARVSLHSSVTQDSGRAWQITGVAVAIAADVEPGTPIPGPAPEDPLVRPLIEALVLNPSDVAPLSSAAPPLPQGLDLDPWRPEPVPGRWVRLMVDQPGPVRVSRAALVAALQSGSGNRSSPTNGREVDLPDLTRVELWRHGARVPVWIEPSGEALIFVAPDEVEPHSGQTAFWLDLQGSASLSDRDRRGPARLAEVPPPAVSPEARVVDPWLETTLEQDGANMDEVLVEPRPTDARADDPASRRAVWTWQELRPDEQTVINLPPLPGVAGTRTAEGEIALRCVMSEGRQPQVHAVAMTFAGGATAEAAVGVQNAFHTQAVARVSAEALRSPTVTLRALSRLTQAQRESLGENGRRLLLDAAVVRRPIAALEVRHSESPDQGGSGSPVLTLVPPGGVSGEVVAEVELPPGVLAFDLASDPPRLLQAQEGDNRRTLVLPGTAWRVAVGRPEDLATPTAIVPWVPVDLTAPSHRADMVIITHPDLLVAAERLAAHHRAAGLAVEVVTVDAIYDWFNGGVPSPVAVRAFLAATLRRWAPPAPAFVTLLGDTSRDRHGDWRGPAIDHVPSFSDPSPAAREVFWQANDLRHVLIAGDDALADAMLGRLSATDASAAVAVVDKVIAYAQSPPLGAWRNRVAFIADNDRVGAQTFDEMCEEVRRESMSPALVADTVYLRRLPWVDNFYLPPEVIDPTKNKVSTEATTRIRDLFNAGQLIVAYYGHGGPNIWADERIWFACDSPRSDNLRLTETRRLPLLVNMTCSSGAIDYPGPTFNVCISEDFLRQRSGAIACYVPTGEGVPQQHQRLTHALMRAIFSEGRRGLGEAATTAGWRFILEGAESDLVEHFVLLGDPALELALPRTVTPRSPAERTLAAGQDHVLRVDVTPETLAGAEGQVTLVDPAGHVAETRTLRRAGGAAVEPQSFTLPADAPTGRWTVAALWWDETTGADELIHAAWELDAPRVDLLRWGLARPDSPAHVGEVVEFTADLRSASRLPVEALGLELVDLAASGATVASAEVALGPGEERRATLRWTATEGFHQFALRAAGGDPWTDAAAARLRERVAVPVVVPGSPARLLTTEAHMLPLPSPADPRRVASLRVTVGNVGDHDAPAGHVTLIGPDGLAAIVPPAAIPPLGPGRTTDVTFDLSSGPPLWASAEATVRLDWADSGGDRESRCPARLMQPLPDLAFVPGSAAVRPENPSEGETIFFDCGVENRGEAEAVDVRVRLEGVGGQELTDRADPRPVTIGRLRPGERRAVTLRWDPTDNAGDQVLRAVVDDAQATLESDESNNTLEARVHVRRGEDVRFTRAVGWRNPRRDPPAITLTTQIANFGETDGRDYVITWYRDPGRTERIGETFIETIAAGQTLDVTFEWLFSPEDVEAQRRGETVAPTCDLGIRTGMRRVEPPGHGEGMDRN